MMRSIRSQSPEGRSTVNGCHQVPIASSQVRYLSHQLSSTTGTTATVRDVQRHRIRPRAGDLCRQVTGPSRAPDLLAAQTIFADRTGPQHRPDHCAGERVPVGPPVSVGVRRRGGRAICAMLPARWAADLRGGGGDGPCPARSPPPATSKRTSRCPWCRCAAGVAAVTWVSITDVDRRPRAEVGLNAWRTVESTRHWPGGSTRRPAGTGCPCRLCRRRPSIDCSRCFPRTAGGLSGDVPPASPARPGAGAPGSPHVRSRARPPRPGRPLPRMSAPARRSPSGGRPSQAGAPSGGCSSTRGRYSTSWMRPSNVRCPIISRATSG